jgi:hypothetical protein
MTKPDTTPPARDYLSDDELAARIARRVTRALLLAPPTKRQATWERGWHLIFALDCLMAQLEQGRLSQERFEVRRREIVAETPEIARFAAVHLLSMNHDLDHYCGQPVA